MSSRRRQLPVEDSWRMVDGENDSFDTSLLPSVGTDDDILFPLSSEQPSSGFPSQQQPDSQSQPQSSSQDSIRDFVKHQADDHVILREPFRPSIPSSVISSPRQAKYRTPDPEFRMPVVDTGRNGKSSGQSSRTVRPNMADGSPRGGSSTDDANGMRRRGYTSHGSPPKRRYVRQRSDDDEYDSYSSSKRRNSPSLPSVSSGILQWVAAVIGLAFHYAKRPLALLLAIYLSCGAIIITQNMLQNSIYVSLSPICRLPGAHLLSLPFCLDAKTGPDLPDSAAHPVEFDDLMDVQVKFEDVLEKSLDGISLPLEMKRSESSVRDLRTLVRHSDLQTRDELMLEFDGFIETAGPSATALQRFNVHVGSLVDFVIIINRFTSRYIDSLVPPSAEEETSSALAAWSDWIFFPFQPEKQAFTERNLRNKYIEHTTVISERIGALVLEAQTVLNFFARAEDHLSHIYDVSSRSAAIVSTRRDEVLWSVWTLIGGNARPLSRLEQQLKLLRKVETQRSTAVGQVNAILHALEAIQAELGNLQERVAEPGVLRDYSDKPASAAATLPLAIHIATIDRGVARLEAARSRIRADEEEKVREALARGGVRNDQSGLIGDVPRS